MTQWIALLGWSLAVLSSVTALPQLLRMLRQRSDAGVSAVSTAAAAATMWAWTCYTWNERDWPAFGSSVGPLVVWASILALLLWRRRDRVTMFAVLVTLLSMVATQMSGAAVVVATVGSMCWIIPQGVHAIRSAELRGVSAGAYLLIFVENIGWVAYGFAVGRYAYAAAPLVQIPVSILIVYRVQRHRRTTQTSDLEAAALCLARDVVTPA